jgi:hypothetical protein
MYNSYNNNRINAARGLVRAAATKLGKPAPPIAKVLGQGSNGVTFLTGNSPPRVLKIALGNASREINALRKLVNAGANFIPRISSNFINIRTETTNNIFKKNLFPQFYSINPRLNSPETIKNRATVTMYVMNKVGSASLWNYVRRTKGGEVNNNNKRVIKSEIKRAVNFMHAHGISHGDLHAGNILVELDASGRMKKLWVIDFGRYVNIPVGKTEREAYAALVPIRTHANYNLFNATKKPTVVLYNGPTGVARKNQVLMGTMYQINRQIRNSVENRLNATAYKGNQAKVNAIVKMIENKKRTDPNFASNSPSVWAAVNKILRGEPLK